MDIQSRKLNLIKSLVSIEDEESIRFLEDYLNQKPSKFTKEELIARAGIASEEISAGKYRTQEELEEESKNW